MKKNVFTTTLVLFFICFSLIAQKKGTVAIKPLSVGMKLPEALWNLKLTVVKGGAEKQIVELNKYRGRLIILDFWATWCGSCVGHLPHVDSLSKVFSQDLTVLLVDATSNRETTQKICTLFSSLIIRYPGFDLQTTFGDKELDKWFPHYSIPHYVWINKDGTVVQITSSEEFNQSNIKRLLSGQKSDVFQKADQDPNRPMYLSKDLPDSNLQQYSLLIKGKIDGLSSSTRIHSIQDSDRGKVFCNKTLLIFYSIIGGEIIPGFTNKRLFIEVRDSSHLFKHLSLLSSQAWDRANFYSYELIVPPGHFGEFNQNMLSDFNRYTPYKLTVTKRKMPCWQLRISGRKLYVPDKGITAHSSHLPDGQLRITAYNMSSLCTFLNTVPGLERTFVDKTGDSGVIDMVFKKGKDSNNVLQTLKDYGFFLEKSEEELDCLVVTDKDPIIKH